MLIINVKHCIKENKLKTKAKKNTNCCITDI